MGGKCVLGLVTKLGKRGFASSAVRGGASASPSSVMLKKSGQLGESKSWAPDPVTGYYRPDNLTKEIDAVELRRLLLKNTTTTKSRQ